MSTLSRRVVLAAGLAGTSTVLGAGQVHAAAPGTDCRDREPDPDAPVSFTGWHTAGQWRQGTARGVVAAPGSHGDGHGHGHGPGRGHGHRARAGIVIGHPIDTVEYTDPHTGETREWEIATWTSPLTELSFGASELIASWNADTPSGSWLQIEMQGRYDDGTETPWYVMGRWAAGEDDITRTSVDGQGDDRSSIYTDTFSIDDPDTDRLAAYRLRLTLHRTPGTDITPTVWRVGAMSSHIPDRFEVPASTPGEAAGIELDVPRYSQSIHSGQYPEFGGGGEAWCSPTSSEMIIESFGRAPSEEDMSWVDPTYSDPQVCHAARRCFDKQYDGCGNWPFNAAYAATFPDMDAIITRLNSLDDVEKLVAAGFPVITSQSFLESELDGAGYGTDGHLMTVIGFTADGDVIANDPASPSNEAVRHVYRRRQFENIWLRTKRYNSSGNIAGGSGGVVYLYKTTDQSWPELPNVE